LHKSYGFFHGVGTFDNGIAFNVGETIIVNVVPDVLNTNIGLNGEYVISSIIHNDPNTGNRDTLYLECPITTTTTAAPDPFICVSNAVNCRAIITDDTITNIFTGGFGSNICQSKPVGTSTFGNIFLSCHTPNTNGYYEASVSTCLWDGSISLVNLGTYGFNVNSYVFISQAEKDVQAGSVSDYTPYNGRYLILSHGPFSSVLQKVGNQYP